MLPHHITNFHRHYPHLQVKKTETNFAELSGDKLTVEQELLVPRGAGTVQGQREVQAMKTIYEKMMLLVM